MKKEKLSLRLHFTLKIIISFSILSVSTLFINCSSTSEALTRQSDSGTKEASVSNRLSKLSPEELTDTNPYIVLFLPVEKALDENNFEKANHILDRLLEEKGEILSIRAWIAFYSNFTHNKAAKVKEITTLILQQVTRELEKKEPELAYAKAIALTSLGQSAFSQADYYQALTYLKEAVSIFPDLATPRALIGDVYKSMAQYENALNWYQSSLVIDPDYDHALAGRVEIFWRENNHNKALELLQQALDKNPRDPHLLKQRGIIFYEIGYYIDAETDFRNALKEKSWDALLWVELGNTLDMQGRSDEAVSAYKKAIQLNPYQKGSHFNLAICYFKQTKFKEAIEHLEQEEKLNPVNEPNLYRLKIVLLQLLGREKEIPENEKKLKALEGHGN